MSAKASIIKAMKLIIDSNNLLHRAYWVYSNRQYVTSPHYLFFNSLKKYINQFRPTDVFCVWDRKLIQKSTNYRKTILGENVYKGTRDKERNAAVYECEEDIRKLTNSVGIKNLYPGVLEADDVIWWLCDNFKDDDKTVVSVDTDLYQLVDSNTQVYTPIKDIIIKEHNFEEIVSVKPEYYVDYKSLMGDKSDNITGLPKCGPKRAKKILEQGVDSVLSDDDKEIFYRNRDIIGLENGVKHHPEETHIYRAELYAKEEIKPDFDRFKELCTKFSIKGILDNFDVWRDAFNIPHTNNNVIDIVNQLVSNK